MSAMMDVYPSRQGHRWEAVPREDPVAWGHPDRGPLSPSRFHQYEREGFLYFDSILSKQEVENLLEEARRLAETAGPPSEGVIREPEGPAVRSVFRVHEKSDAFRSLCADVRLADVARQMLGGEVMLHQTRINYKPPFVGKEFFWHSDFETWHVEDGMPRMRAVSVSLNLTESHEHNGPLLVVPGSHKTFVRCVGETPKDHYLHSLRRQEIGTPDPEALTQLIDEGGIRSLTGPPGSATFFECNILHASNVNLSPRPRTNVFIVFNSVENELTEPFGGRPARPEFLAHRTSVPVSRLV